MEVREELAELLKEIPNEKGMLCLDLWDMRAGAEDIADALIDRGVTVQKLDGCEFCNAEYAEWSEGVSHDFRIKGNALYYYDNIYGWEGIIIHHCPMCGRKLPKENDYG